MQIELIAEQGVLAQRGAELIAQAARDSIRQRGKFLFAVSGGAVVETAPVGRPYPTPLRRYP